MPAWILSVSKWLSLSRISPWIKVRYPGWQSAATSIDVNPSSDDPVYDFWSVPVRWLRGFLAHPFIRSVTVLISGTAAAQLVTIAFSPLITRLYGPEVFGTLGIFLAIVAFITPLANLAYAYAIVLPASDDEAHALFRLSIYIGMAVAGLSALIFASFHQKISELIGFTSASELLFLVPFIVLLSASREPLYHWLLRKKQFGVISRIVVVVAVLGNIAKTATGLVLTTAPVLLILTTLANVTEVFLLWLGARRTLPTGKATGSPDQEPAESVTLQHAAYRYRDFPLFRAPNDWLNVVSNSIPSLMLAALLGPAAAGFYLLARRVVGLPIGVIAGAVGTVFLPRVAEASHKSEPLRPLLLKGTLGLAFVGLIPFGIVILAGPWLFSFVFGAQWAPTGYYARWLAIWFYCAFAAVPSLQVVAILGLQGHFLLYEIAVVTLRVASLAAGALIWQSDIVAIALYSIVGALVNIAQIVWCVLSCDTRHRENI
jgi:O-antigen/teichoic acid export membrane protein